MYSTAKVFCLILVFTVGICKSEYLSVPYNETDPEIPDGGPCRSHVNNNVLDILEELRDRMNDTLPMFGIPALDPLLVDEMTLNETLSEMLIGFSMRMYNVTVLDISTFQANDLDFNLLGFEVEFELFIPSVTLFGQHESSGFLMGIIPVEGQGNFNVTIFNISLPIVGRVNHTGIEWETAELSLNLTISGISGRYEGLSDEFFNELINLSGAELLELAWPSLQPGLTETVKATTTVFFNTFTLEQLMGMLFGNGFPWSDLNTDLFSLD